MTKHNLRLFADLRWRIPEEYSCSSLGSKGSIISSLNEVRVSSEMLSIDENVWHSSLLGHLQESILDLRSVGDLIKLLHLVGDTLLLEKILGLNTEWAVWLRVNHDLVRGNLSLDIVSVGSTCHLRVCIFLLFSKIDYYLNQVYQIISWVQHKLIWLNEWLSNLV